MKFYVENRVLLVDKKAFTNQYFMLLFKSYLLLRENKVFLESDHQS